MVNAPWGSVVGKFATTRWTPSCIIITRDSAITVRDALTVAPITRTLWHIPVEVTLDNRDGMPTACVVNCDNLLTIPKSLLQSHICTLTTGKMQTVEQAIKFALALT